MGDPWGCGEVDELRSEGDETVDVREVRCDPQRRADGAAGWQADLSDVVVEGHAVPELAADERLAGDRECDLACAGVAEAACAKGDVVVAGDAVDVALVDDSSVRVQEVERDGCASLLPGSRSVDRRCGRAVRVLELTYGVE